MWELCLAGSSSLCSYLASVICYYVILLLCGILLYHKHGDSDAVTVYCGTYSRTSIELNRVQGEEGGKGFVLGDLDVKPRQSIM